MNFRVKITRCLYAVCLLLLTAELAAELRIEQGFVRGLPPGQPNTAAFMRLLNDGPADVLISHASSKSAQRVEIHAHRHNNGMMSMEQVDAITVPAGGEFVFAPGDHHIMLIGLIKPISEGDQVDLSLSADNGEVIKLLLPVRSVLNEH